MNCKKCKSEKLNIVKAGPHQKLVCAECLAFQKFISKKDADTFRQLHNMPLCEKCKDTGIDPHCVDTDGGWVKCYCDCAIGDKRIDDEMCSVCSELKENCICAKEEEASNDKRVQGKVQIPF